MLQIGADDGDDDDDAALQLQVHTGSNAQRKTFAH